jgi:hypothetical protein
VPLPLEAVIHAVVALDHALNQGLFPQARHQTRVIALRSDSAGFPGIAALAHNLREVLEQAIRPSPTAWADAREALHRAIDEALS